MVTSEYLKSRVKAKGTDLPEPQSLGGKSIAGVSLAAPALRMVNDGVLIAVSALLAMAIRLSLLRHISGSWNHGAGVAMTWMGLVYLSWFIFCYIFVARGYGLYALVPLRNGAHETRLIVQSVLIATLFLCGAIYMMRDIAASRLLVILLAVVTSVILSVRRTTWRRARYRDYERGIELRNVLVLGTNRLSAALGDQMMNHNHLGYHLSGYITVPGSREDAEAPRERILGDLGDLRQLVRGRFIDELVIAQPCSTEVAVRLVEQAHELDIDVSSVTGYFPDLSANAPVERIGCYPVVMLHRRERRVLSLLLKRVVDIILSSMALIAISPVLSLISIAILIEGKGPIFYVSQRIGKRGRSFPCFKFRTMVPDAEKRRHEIAALNERDGILFKVSNDPRITPLGAMLRKYSLDELPQFFNVLRGEMSIVGPRPPIASEVERYELEHLRRLEVLPGLTGLWQVHARQDSSFDRYIALDTAYVENWSFWLDLTILLRTMGVVLRGTGS